MRPKKTRWVKCRPCQRVFKPQTDSVIHHTKEVVLTLDEFEAVRLLDHERLSQTQVAGLMKVHRSTVSRIAACARWKITKALVGIYPLKIEGGCCKITGGR